MLMSGERNSVNQIIADFKEQENAKLQGTDSEICGAVGCLYKVQLHLDMSVVAGVHRAYPDGSGSLPYSCSDQSDCLAKKLLQ